jgi:hypothetical protein
VPPTFPGLSPREAGLKAVKLAKQKELNKRASNNKRPTDEYGIYDPDNPTIANFD